MFKKLFGKKSESGCGSNCQCGSKKEVIRADILIPITGEMITLEKVPDPVFSEKMMGEGFAIIPEKGEIYSPVDGVVASISEGKHAIAIESSEGDEIIIHFGIDTVNLGGEGFSPLVKVGDSVVSGQLINRVDIEAIKDRVPSLITPVLFTNLEASQLTMVYGPCVAKESGKVLKK